MALTREERADVSRRNARKSTGPRTEQGKAASRANAMKHGLTARQLAPTTPEEASEYDLRRRLWHDDLRPVNVLEAALVDRACRANWKLDLCARYDDALRSTRGALVPSEGPSTSRDDYVTARRLIHNLMATREAPTSQRPPCLPGEFDEPDDPDRVRAALCEFAEGVACLLTEWDRIVSFLDKPSARFADHRTRAVRLLGLRSEAELACPLREAAQDEMARLEALHVELTEGPSDAPETDLDPDLLMRYEAAAEREFHRSVNTFLRLRKNPDLLPPPDLDSVGVDYIDPPPPEPELEAWDGQSDPTAEPPPASSPLPNRRRPPVRNEASAPADSDPERPSEPSRRGSRRGWDGVDPFDSR